ncbi:riboflavin synthase [bacterium CG_4_9_14_3_um_filter_65_15]|nr:MAG: riboflavin synthase [bacterium CG_4_9_14_3_um_filter_65_15]
MFTGLVREIGKLRGSETRGDVLRLRIHAPRTASGVEVGDSVAVQGICLTVVGRDRVGFSVEAAVETRRLTTLGSWRPGRLLHLEPALRLGDALDGHLVQGHVDGTGRVRSLGRARGGHSLTIAYPPGLGRFLTPKGSVAVDGVSLTVDEGPFTGTFTVNLIPHTMAETCFSLLRAGSLVNLEMDVLVKSVRSGQGHPLAAGGGGDAASPVPESSLTMERILAAGYGRRTRKGKS